MGIRVVLETERGECVEAIDDPMDALHVLLEGVNNDRYQMLCYIDRYGDTVFNHLQIDRFISEWADRESLAMDAEDRIVFQGVLRLAGRVKAEPYFYLKFYGD